FELRTLIEVGQQNIWSRVAVRIPRRGPQAPFPVRISPKRSMDLVGRRQVFTDHDRSRSAVLNILLPFRPQSGTVDDVKHSEPALAAGVDQGRGGIEAVPVIGAVGHA